MCSAISTLSLGYTPQKKNEWCEAIVLLTGMTSQAVRFCVMKHHVQKGLLYRTAHGLEHDGRYALFVRDIAMQNRWNKLSKAMRRGEYPYVFSHYSDHGPYATGCVTEYSAGYEVSLINDKDKARQKFRRRLDKWNGPLGNGIRKHEEERRRKRIMEREAKRIAKKMGSTVSESMHGFWYGSADNFRYEVASLNCLPRPTQMFRDNRYLLSATPPLDCLKVVLQVEKNLASTLPVVKNIWNEGGLLAFCRGTRRQKFRRRIDKWNGPLGNSIRKHEEESKMRWLMDRERKQNAKMMDSTVSGSMHGFWYGSLEDFKYEVASAKCLPRPAQMFRNNRYLLSATPPLERLKVVLQVRTNLASTLPVVNNIGNEGRLLAFFRGTSMISENWGSRSYFWLRRPSPNPSLGAAMLRAIVDCTSLVLTAAASDLCAKRHKVKVDKIKLLSGFNSVSTFTKDLCFDHFGIQRINYIQKK